MHFKTWRYETCSPHSKSSLTPQFSAIWKQRLFRGKDRLFQARPRGPAQLRRHDLYEKTESIDNWPGCGDVGSNQPLGRKRPFAQSFKTNRSRSLRKIEVGYPADY